MAVPEMEAVNSTNGVEVEVKQKTNGTSVENVKDTSAAETTEENNGTTPTDTTKKDSDRDDEAKPEESPWSIGSITEIKALVSRYDSTGQQETIERSKYLSSKNERPFNSYVLVSKQHFDVKGKIEKTTVEINSPEILDALRELVTYYPAEPLDFDGSATYDSPFTLLNHYRDELEAFAARSGNETTKAHVQLLLEYLESEAGDGGRQAVKLIQAGIIAFDKLWMVFKPGELLYTTDVGHERLFLLQKTGYGVTGSGCKYFEVSCAYTSCDGVKAGTSSVDLLIWENKEFVGKAPTAIRQLSVHPLRYSGCDGEELKGRLTERGKKYLEVVGARPFHYDGLYQYLKMPPSDHYDEKSTYDGVWMPRSMTGRVVIDAKTFAEEVRRRKEENAEFASIFGRFGADKGEGEKKGCGNDVFGVQTCETDPLLCPPYLYGFELDSKEWCKFFLENLNPIEWKANAMDSIFIPDRQRRLITALVTAHRFPDHARDEAALKGKGLIALLHGTPGSGKTLTAEMVAEHTKRPLLKISTGELGSWEHEISAELRKLLTYASLWHAIVLMDEADVFLEARRSGVAEQMERNALVAEFLRQLEYFQGILFLTSNRVSVFDAAIKSRLHLALKYQAPDQATRRRIWEQHILLADTHDDDLDMEKALGVLEKPDMNGREIANAVNTARTLATSEDTSLRLEHLETVISVWTDFQATLKEIEKEDLEGFDIARG
ncbi:P-loop containing nucleoside triphosphate hydrolase protein [Patellaria atrata CBS 101060]|uniref:P-loop containing nucleoside triphosphate hydrolase protein n=1 Tax=Patellaria atrata CBS 101060 TaxID=1346257 RepID=A0A9P4VLH0_9PEZI|nr:P-loop containing nucleoside triphosphate hydrolase protein [Patellaria atrata CBS 101060]